MSGATGAGSTGTETDGGRGSATGSTASHDSEESQGGTVTDARGPQTQQYATDGGSAAPGDRPTTQFASPLPRERRSKQQSGPYHPPQAYRTAPEGQESPGGAPEGPEGPTSPAGGPGGAVRRPRTGARTTPRTRKARLRVAKADPWSVMKVSFLLSIALGICTIVAAAVLWMVMDAMGVFSTVGGTISEATGSNESNGFDLQSFLSLPNVLLFTSIIAVIDVVLATALATLGAFIYNLSAGFVGGVELTLAEDE